MATDAEIQNQALSRIGEPAQVDGSPADTAITLHYAPTVAEVLRSHRWNFAIKRVILQPDWVIPTTIADNSSGLYRVTKSTHGLVTGNRVTFDASEDYPGTNYQGIQGTWVITRNDANTFDLDDSTFNGSGTVDARYSLAAAFDWAFSIPTPSDMLRALGENDGQNACAPSWEYEGQRILTNSSSMRFFYIRSDLTDAIYGDDPLFVTAVELCVAMKIAPHLGRADRIPELKEDYRREVMPLARRIDAAESRTRPRLFPRQSGFVAARGAGSGTGWFERYMGLDG